MTTDPVPGSDAITVLDTEMFGVPGYTAAFLVDADDTVLVDTGLSTTVDALRTAVEEAGSALADVDTVVVSHVHLDHAGGLAAVVDASDARVLCHPAAEPYLTEPEAVERLVRNTREAMGSLGDAYGTAEAVDPDRVATLDHGDRVDCGDGGLEAIHATGHAPHHLALHHPADDALFVVDEGCTYVDGRELPTTPPPNFDLEATLDSFERFRARDPDVLLYGHYGANSGGVAAIERHEEALLDWVDAIETAREEHEETDAIVEAVASSYAEDVDDPMFEAILRRDVRGVLRYLGDG